ncbi:MAG: glycoside hydrolase family 95 protein [Akkermansiaceae bacterium]|nr:glycoside hydrolase family 95 protein [Akkermansiaceae bacterium]
MRLILPFLALAGLAMAQAPSLLLEYKTPPKYLKQPASEKYSDPAMAFPHSDWMREGLPIGNGRLGAMVMGDPLNERIQFNEISLWTGGANESGKYSADEPGGFGSYQNFGDLFITMKGMDRYENYRRSLDLATGIHTTTWTSDGVTYKREVFCSHPDECIVIRMTADKPVEIFADIEMRDTVGEPAPIQNRGSDGIYFNGELDNGMQYAALVRSHGCLSHPIPDKNQRRLAGSQLELRLYAATNYALDAEANFRSKKTASQKITEWSTGKHKPYDELHTRHLTDFTKLMGRVTLDIGAPPEGLDLHQRLERYRQGSQDPHLEMLLFQMGRYLLISSSRHCLPANLQGLWNDMNHPAWNSDYHTNINIQMNYWPVEVANLSECAMPLFNWIEASIPGSRAATQKAFGEDTPGWTMRTSVNISGGNGWEWNLPASAWFCLHYWEHYTFTRDEVFLRERAWPIFEEVCQFWLAKLIEKDGKLLVPDGWSPEHGPREDGPAHDQQVVWALFTHTLEAAKVLEINNDLVKQVRIARSKLLGPEIGTWGQIMEWRVERPTLEKSQHRHTSHLFAVYPGSQITLQQDPELAKAAVISLAARGNAGDSRRSWTWGWRCALWARLGMPSQASDMVRGQLTWNTLPNLLATHPPFQFDGNAGITAGMCEMFVQSHADAIFVMPAISTKRNWRQGSFKGLKARGGFEVGGSWKDRAARSASIVSQLGNPVTLRIPNIKPATIQVIPSEGEAFEAKRREDGTYHFQTRPGERYDITWKVTEAKVDR